MIKQTWVVGDLHGELDKLKNCLSQVPLNKEDRIVFLGDYVDRGPDVYGVIEYLLKLKESYECIFILGNHDECWFNSMKRGDIENGLLWRQGAKQTLQSYIDVGIRPEVHYSFFEKMQLYYIDEERNYFVHGGFNRHYLIDEQPDPTVYTWDRDLFHCALSYETMYDKSNPFKIKGKPKEIFIGHTPTMLWNKSTPIHAANIWNLDTGCGKYKEAKLTIMNIDTKQFFQA